MSLNFLFCGQERQDATSVYNQGQKNLQETRHLKALIPGCETA